MRHVISRLEYYASYELQYPGEDTAQPPQPSLVSGTTVLLALVVFAILAYVAVTGG
jgi:hypothetical protein